MAVHWQAEPGQVTAAVAGALAERGIPANVIGAYHHDHVFVPSHQLELALEGLDAGRDWN